MRDDFKGREFVEQFQDNRGTNGRLILMRRAGESILINGGIEIMVTKIENSRVYLSFVAPKEMLILRKELQLPGQELD